jgi:hypothetical protein
MPLSFNPYRWTAIATHEGRFVDFAPYVASINDAGTVAFQATLADGHSGVFTGDGQAITDVAVTALPTCPARLFCSHPDINQAGLLTVYARLPSGDAVLLLHPGGEVTVVGVQDGLASVGPLGPAMNDHGDAAIRGTTPSGRAGVAVWRGGQLHIVAETGASFCGFEGLPVINLRGQLAFRAALPGGGHGVFLYAEGRCEAIARTGDAFEEIARFPALNDQGTVAFAATPTGGPPGVFMASPDGVECVVDARAGFESFRGVLINNAGPVVFYATPTGGQLGVYAGPDPARHRLLGLGDTLFGARVTDFALNPVSVNERGQLAIRVALDDGRQFILRGDPAP